jgi:hypothetical protein
MNKDWHSFFLTSSMNLTGMTTEMTLQNSLTDLFKFTDDLIDYQLSFHQRSNESRKTKQGC